MRSVLIAVFVMAASGCTFGLKTCEVNTDCNVGSTCSNGFCVAGDSGTGGGSTGGGTTTGGGSGGGATGGGTGGGESDAGIACALRTTPCPTGYECRETLPSEANCVLAFESLTLQVADGGSLFNTRGPAVRLSLSRKAGFNTAGAPSSVAVSVVANDGGITTANIAGASAEYVGTVVTTADGVFLATGAVTFTNEDAGVDTISSASVSFAVDTLGPQLSWQMLSAQPYKRDDIVVVKVDSLEALSEASATLNGVSLTRLSTCADAAACFRADFSQPELAAMSASWPLEVVARDLAGNVSDGGVTTQVTRVRWVGTVPGGDLRAAPAVGSDGTIYVGTTNSASTVGVLARIDANDGGILSSTSLYGGIVSISVSPVQTDIGGGEVLPLVFVGSNTSSFGELRGLPPDLLLDGGVALQPHASSRSTHKTWSGIALTRTTGDAVSAYAATTSSVGSPGRLLRWDSSGGPVTYDQPQLAGLAGSPITPLAVAAKVPTAVGIVISGTDAHLLTAQPFVGAGGMPDAGLFWRRFTSVNSVPMFDTTPRELENETVSIANGQALVGGNSIVGVSANGSRLHRVSAAATMAGQPGGASNYGTPAIANANTGFVGLEGKIVRFDPSNLMVTEVVVATIGGDTALTSPVLGKAMNGRPALGYSVTDSGNLVVFDARTTGAPTPAWPAVVPGVASTVAAHPSFDCNRRANSASGTTGILYIPYLDGHVASVIVDSPRLADDANAWPKYQRSMGNAGNDDTTFFPTNWACP